MKKHIIILLSLLSVYCISFAQTQQGFVKTLGRPDKAGQPLSGVTIRAKGGHNTVLSDSQGFFALPLAGKQNGDTYTLQQVQKNGYELNETNVIGKQQVFSDKVPLTLVMVSTEVLQAEKRRIESNAFRSAERNYKTQTELLESQLRDSLITMLEYREQLLDLQDKFEKYQSLINGLAEHYAHTDYDMLDDKDREINICIENGELERADSLINALFDPLDVLQRNMEALASIEQQIGQAQGIIDKANADMAAVLKQQEKDAEYLYQLYTIALGRYDNDKALFYIETRAALDTTNVEWLLDAGGFAMNYLTDIEKASHYYNLALSVAQAANNAEWIANCYNDIGEMYCVIGELDTAIENLSQSIATRNTILEENHISFTDSYCNLGYCYALLGQFDEAMELFESALTIRQEHLGMQNNDVALSINNLGMMHLQLGETQQALECFNQALEIQLAVLGENSEDVACSYNNIAGAYSDLDDPEKAIEYEVKCLNIYKSIFGETHPEVAIAYINLCVFHNEAGRSEESIIYGQKALDIYLRLFGEDNLFVAQCYNNLGVSYESLEDYDKALEYANKSLAIKLDILGEDHPSLVNTYNNIGSALDNLGQYEESIVYYSKALTISIEYYGEVHPSVSRVYVNLAHSYEHLGNYDEALRLMQKGIEALPEGHPSIPKIQQKIADIQAKKEQGNK